MKLSISNIAWSKDDDEKMYPMIADMGYRGLEIAPSRIFGSKPYEDLKPAEQWSNMIRTKYHLEISSIQSIWYGRTENIFHSAEERESLIGYTKKAIRFAETLKCRNLVFGCPKNRNIGTNAKLTAETAIDFFGTIGDYAKKHGTVVALEANPGIYNTNFLNTLDEVRNILDKTGTKGLGVNLDIGAMLYNNENLQDVRPIMPYVNHVHISEPYLALINRRPEHAEIISALYKNGYDRFVSIEMGNGHTLNEIAETMKYVKELCASAESEYTFSGAE